MPRHDIFVFFDSRSTGVGSLFAIVNPDNISDYLQPESEDRLPIMPVGRAIPVIIPNHSLLSRPIIQSSTRQHAFCYHNVSIKIERFQVVPVTCIGTFCDALDMYQKGVRNNSRRCACFKTQHNSGYFCIKCFITVQISKEKQIVVSDHTSKKFTSFFMKRGNIDCPTVHEVFLHRKAMILLDETLSKIVKLVNNGGVVTSDSGPNEPHCKGWDVIGWSRRGVADDAADTEDTGVFNAAKKAKFTSSECTYHLSSITPTFIPKDDASIVPLQLDLKRLATVGIENYSNADVVARDANGIG